VAKIAPGEPVADPISDTNLRVHEWTRQLTTRLFQWRLDIVE
jgi:hypothetical protein